ncbi:MAG: HAMP domain-containing histidine kinase [Candidatus Cyclonatronum sp.]|uniref:sensor histidine kinase n=1 Tax=Cyclonatronum sp. TaxID=3024185 RepID=UPI0025BF5E8A|nr:HAMP domain-containing sensor histidine kinase [Cyclonatronum sp.]MCH8485768.1 HAMP domain-containing histidine kinase [Cyclonatronum sp.]
MNLALFKALSKYPFIYNNEFYDSNELTQNRTCTLKCKEKDCLTFNRSTEVYSSYVCSKGYDNYYFSINDFSIILNGLISEKNRSVPKGRKDVRTEYLIRVSDIDVFINKIEVIVAHLERTVNETIEMNFSMFHDFKTSMSIFFSCTQDLINRQPGSSFEEKLLNSDPIYQDLFNSLELITSQLGMIDIIVNPKSISFGTKRPINPYKLFEKIKILFDHLANKKKGITINITADSKIRDCYCYESIEFIPLILIHNALKYSSPHSTIEIKLEQRSSIVRIIVKNIGPYVSDDNTLKIFEKFFRDPSAADFSKEGIGIGLWIAKSILTAHSSDIRYFKDKYGVNGVGLNIFEIELEST